MNHPGRYAFFGLSVLFVLLVVEQAFVAGLGLFRDSGAWDLHIGLGHMVGVVPLAMLVLALVLRFGRMPAVYAGLLFAGTVLQTEVFVLLREAAPAVAAFHPVLALILFAGGSMVAQYAWGFARRPVEARPDRAIAVPGSGAPECVPAPGASC